MTIFHGVLIRLLKTSRNENESEACIIDPLLMIFHKVTSAISSKQAFDKLENRQFPVILNFERKLIIYESCCHDSDAIRCVGVKQKSFS